MKERMVSYTVDLNNLPKLSAARKAEFKALADRTDSEIGYSDIPPLTEEF